VAFLPQLKLFSTFFKSFQTQNSRQITHEKKGSCLHKIGDGLNSKSFEETWEGEANKLDNNGILNNTHKR